MKNEMLRNPTKYIKIIFCSNKKQKVEKYGLDVADLLQ